MAELFSDILNMSLTASVIIVLVLLARLGLKRVPKIYSYVLWAVVLFRLLCPVSLSSSVSALKVADVTLQSIAETQVTQTQGAGTTIIYIPARQNAAAVPVESVSSDTAPADGRGEIDHSLPGWMGWVWIGGVVLLAVHSLLVYLRLYRSLTAVVRLIDNIYLVDHIPSAFVLGMIRPKIYLPSGTPMEERLYIIAHERHHIRRGDHIIKLLAYLALCLHWFNPLVWLTFFLAGKDMEMSCDEAVIRKLGDHIRADYSQTLLRLATHKHIVGTPLAFGEGDTKSRVLNLAHWKKPKVWVSQLCLLLCAAVLISCAVNPEKETDSFADGPADVGLGSLNLRLPKGCSAKRWTPGKLDFVKEEKSVGGIYRYDAPNFALLPDGTEGDWNGREWVKALGLPEEAEDSATLYSSILHNEPEGSNGYKLYGDLVAAYWPVETDQPGTVHYFYMDDEDVYDVWFDETILEKQQIEQIMDTARLSRPVQQEGTVLGEGVLHWNNFHVCFPGGFFYRTESDGSIAIYDGYQDVGGVTVYPMPDDRVQEEPVSLKKLENHSRIPQSLGIPEALDAAMQHGTTTDSYGDLEARFWTEEETPESGTAHYLYYDYAGGEVFDLWFDLGKMELMDTWLFLDTAYTMLPGATLTLEEFTVTLPEGVDWKAQGSNACLFTVAGQEYGGLGQYPLREPLTENVDWFDWIAANRLPTRYEEGMWRSAGNSNYGDFYFRCGTEGEDGLDYRHIFYITDENVYILWFDWTLIRDNAYRAIMQNAVLNWEEPTVSTKEESMEKCRAVLEAIQSGSCNIRVERSDYTQEYLRHDEDGLSVVTVTMGGMVDKHASLLVGGTRFGNMGNRSAETLIWEEYPGGGGLLKPWLDSFDWDAHQVSHVRTQPENGGEAVTVLISKAGDLDAGTSYTSYFSTFHFDKTGKFVNVVVQADMSMEHADVDYEVTRTETVISLNEDSIAERIEAEYSKAITK